MPRRNHETRKDAFQISQHLVVRPLTRFLVGLSGSSHKDARAGRPNLQENHPCSDAVLGVHLW